MYKRKMSNINYVGVSSSSPPPWFLPSLKLSSLSSSSSTFSRPFRLSSTWFLYIIACICAIVNLITLIEALNYSTQLHTNPQSSATSKSNDLYRITSSTSAASAGVSLPSNYCHRCSNNHSLASLVIQEAKLDCISGHYFVSLKNNDRCECELICSRMSGQSCHPYQSTQNLYNLAICDPYLKLFCNEKSKLCQGNANSWFFGLISLLSLCTYVLTFCFLVIIFFSFFRQFIFSNQQHWPRFFYGSMEKTTAKSNNKFNINIKE